MKFCVAMNYIFKELEFEKFLLLTLFLILANESAERALEGAAVTWRPLQNY